MNATPDRAIKTALALFFAQAVAALALHEDKTLVVFNANVAESRELANFYAKARGIAPERVVGLKCPDKEEVTREEYDKTIANPLREVLVKNGWWKMRIVPDQTGRVESSQIRFLALIKGLPIGIQPTVNYPGDQPGSGPAALTTRNEATVDSELTTLGLFTPQISGTMNNPFFERREPWVSVPAPSQFCVARLDAPTAEVVKRMITDSIAVERDGLRGFAYVDARGTEEEGLKVGDRWLFNAAAVTRRQMLPTVLDAGEGLFPADYPMRRAAVYYGWYAEAVTGPMAQAGFKFERGAVAVHLHSFSAATIRDPARYWCAPLLMRGAAATLGTMYEPFLGFYAKFDHFHARLASGGNLAESAWSATRALSWVNVVLGDPLYRPFANQRIPADADDAAVWAAYGEGMRMWFEKDPAQADRWLLDKATEMKAGMLAEGLGLMHLSNDDPEAAITAFEAARKIYTNGDDAARSAIHEVLQLKARGDYPKAGKVISETLEAFPRALGAETLRGILATLSPPSPPKPSAP